MSQSQKIQWGLPTFVSKSTANACMRVLWRERIPSDEMLEARFGTYIADLYVQCLRVQMTFAHHAMECLGVWDSFLFVKPFRRSMIVAFLCKGVLKI